jgi:hypothetical protein
MRLSRRYFQFSLLDRAYEIRHRTSIHIRRKRAVTTTFRAPHQRRRPFRALPSTVVRLKQSLVLEYDNAREMRVTKTQIAQASDSSCVCGWAKPSIVSTKYKTKPSMSHRNGAHRAGESSVPLQCLTRPTDRSGTGL